MNLAQSLELLLIQLLGAEKGGNQFHFHAFVYPKNGFGLLSVWMWIPRPCGYAYVSPYLQSAGACTSRCVSRGLAPSWCEGKSMCAQKPGSSLTSSRLYALFAQADSSMFWTSPKRIEYCYWVNSVDLAGPPYFQTTDAQCSVVMKYWAPFTNQRRTPCVKLGLRRSAPRR